MLNSGTLMLGMVMFVLWVIAAWVLRMGCGTVLGRGGRKPGLLGAMMLVLLAAAATVGTQFALGAMMGMSSFGFEVTAETANRLRLMLSLPLHLIVTATIYKMLLPTTFGRATLIWAVQAAVIVALFMLFRCVAVNAGAAEFALPQLDGLKWW